MNKDNKIKIKFGFRIDILLNHRDLKIKIII
jgi:hypothetical protein